MEFEFISNKPRVYFIEDLDCGDVFMYDDQVYIRIDEECVDMPDTSSHAAIYLKNGLIDFIPAQAEVIPMTAKTILIKKL